MATRYLTRSLFTALSRPYTSLSLSTPPPSIFSFSLLRLRPLIAVAAVNLRSVSPAVATSFRGFATRQTSSSLNDPNPNWSNRPPKETILLDGCDFEHWLVVMEKPEGDPTRDEIIDSYIKTLAKVVGSEEEARMKIYSVSTRHYYAFGALVSEELSYKLKEVPKVSWVLPDSYLDVKNKDYGGEPFINGQAVPYDPKYHEEWVRNNARANEKNRRNDRPRNFDRSRNFERRREMQNTGPNMGGGPPNMTNAPPPNMGGMQQPNMGGRHQPSMGGPQQPNMGGAPHNYGGAPPNNYGGSPPNNYGGAPPNYYGGAPNNPTNFQYNGGPTNGGMPYQTSPGPNQNYASNTSGGNPYQNQSMPGRDVPPPNQNYAPNTADRTPYQNQNMPGRDMPPQNYQ
ncbi:multiple organellar RNA editing factor 8, chloroplastic/mitochondrial-like [Nicotiana tabacum]|uniref:Multiple organellar RNA editing factor 8, chloroplastic/mitochondrial-like n=1 Tax=Nicotiana tabacum TaxID=4097 RepID=A0A1S3ZW24_TOBAC|nr:PREDICTED: multiple organellar RNA editing factor 8, chloroplastic/mitochondrial-like [Nicotiana tabacum]